MIAAMTSGWRVDTKLDQAGERAWNIAVADEEDSARPGKCCFHVMEDRGIFLVILRSLEFDIMQGLFGISESFTMPLTLRSFVKNLARTAMGTRKQHSPCW